MCNLTEYKNRSKALVAAQDQELKSAGFMLIRNVDRGMRPTRNVQVIFGLLSRNGFENNYGISNLCMKSVLIGCLRYTRNIFQKMKLMIRPINQPKKTMLLNRYEAGNYAI